MSQVQSASHVLGAKQNSQGECVHHQCPGSKATKRSESGGRIRKKEGRHLLSGGGEDQHKTAAVSTRDRRPKLALGRDAPHSPLLCFSQSL